MSQQLPEQVDPFRLARQRRVMTGEMDVSRMARLAPVLNDVPGVARIALEFGVDDMGVQFVRGQVSADLSMMCQRCLQPMAQHVDSEFALGLVTNERDAERLPTHYEPLFITDEHIVLRDVIEDELLLALPIVAMHAAGTCEQAVVQGDEPAPVKKENPFAVLQELKPRLRGNS